MGRRRWRELDTDSSRSGRDRLSARLRWGIGWGVFYSAVLLAWAVFLFLIGGQAPFEKKATTFQEVAALYAFSGPVTGLLVGLLRPLARNAILAAGVGMAASIPASIAMTIGVVDTPPWTGEHTFVAVFSCLLLGGMCGAGAYRFLR